MASDNELLESILGELQEIKAALQDGARQGGGSGAAAAGQGGAAADSTGALGRKIPRVNPFAALRTAAQFSEQSGLSEAVRALRTGSSEGAARSRGVLRGIETLTSAPLGDVVFAQTSEAQRISGRALGEVQGLTDRLARAGAGIDPEGVRQLYARQREIETRVENARKLGRDVAAEFELSAPDGVGKRYQEEATDLLEAMSQVSVQFQLLAEVLRALNNGATPRLR